MDFAPHIRFLDNAKSFDESNFDFADCIKMVNEERIQDLIKDAGILKHPEGPTGKRFGELLKVVFAYLLAAALNGCAKIQFPFAKEIPAPKTRKIVIDTLLEGGILSLMKRGFAFAGGETKSSVWEISNLVWYFLSETASKNLMVEIAQKYQAKANTRISINNIIGGKKFNESRIIAGANDEIIRQTAEKYPFMIACQTVYNDNACKTNGRIYHPIQGLPKVHRETLLSILHGQAMSTVDIKSSQIRLFQKVAGRKVGWTEDLYAKLEGVEDISRESIKLATSVYFNAEKNKMFSAKNACENKFGEMTWNQAKRFQTAIDKMSGGIISKSKGLGLRLMNIEGKAQAEMMAFALERNIPWFPMHDGGHCPEWAAEMMQAKLEEVIDRIIAEMTMEERAEILDVSEDELLLIQAGIAPKAEQKQQTDSADDAFIREFLNSRKAA